MSSIKSLVVKIRNFLNFRPIRKIDELLNPVEELGRQYLDKSHKSLTEYLGIEPDKIPPPDVEVRYLERAGKIPCGTDTIHIDRAEIKRVKGGEDDRFLKGVADHEAYHHIRHRLHPGIREEYNYGPDERSIAEEALTALVETDRNYSPTENLEYLSTQRRDCGCYEEGYGLGYEAAIALAQYSEQERQKILRELTYVRDPNKIIAAINTLRKLKYEPKEGKNAIAIILILISFFLGLFLSIKPLNYKIIGNLVLPIGFNFILFIAFVISFVFFAFLLLKK